MRVLGLDPSLTHSAAAWYEDGELHTRAVLSKSEEDGLERLSELRARFSDIAERFWLTEQRVLAIEGFSFGSKGRAVFQIGWLGFELRLMFRRAGWHILDVPPNTLKAFVTGKGNAPKELMIRDVFKRWKYEAKDNNDADAFALLKLGQAVTDQAAYAPNAAERKLFSKLSVLPPAKLSHG